MLSTVWISILVLILSLLYGNLLLALFYYASFFPLRGYGGGFRAKTHWGCALLQCACFSTASLGTNFLYTFIDWPILVLGYALIMLIVFINAPAEHPDNPIDENKKIVLKSRYIITVIALCLLAMGLSFFGFSVYASMTFFASWAAIISMLAKNKPVVDV